MSSSQEPVKSQEPLGIGISNSFTSKDPETPSSILSIENLLREREQAAAIIREQAKAELGHVPRPLEKCLTSLLSDSRVDDLLGSSRLASFIPLLGAVHRQDKQGIKNASQLILDNFVPSIRKRILRPTYGKLIFLAAVSINLLINYFINTRLNLIASSDPHQTSKPVAIGSHNILSQNLTLSILAIISIFVLWEVLVTYRDQIFERISAVPLLGLLFAGTRYTLSRTAIYTHVLAELLDGGMPANVAIKQPCVRQLSGGLLPYSVSFALRQNDVNTPSQISDHLRNLGNIYSYNSLIRHKKSTIYATSTTLLAGLMVYWAATTLTASISEAIRWLV